MVLFFKIDERIKLETLSKFQEHVIDAANKFIESLEIDVYEQQYHYSFDNWLPFFWNRYTAITRYTYVINKTFDIEEMWKNISSSYRNLIRKGYKIAEVFEGDNAD